MTAQIAKSIILQQSFPPTRIVPKGQGETLFCFALVNPHLITASVQIFGDKTEEFVAAASC